MVFGPRPSHTVLFQNLSRSRACPSSLSLLPLVPPRPLPLHAASELLLLLLVHLVLPLLRRRQAAAGTAALLL